MGEKQKSPIMRIWDLGKDHHGKLKQSMVLSVIGIVIGLIPYYCAAKIMGILIEGNATLSQAIPLIVTAFACSILKAFLTVGSTAISHKATFAVLAETREKCLQKLAKMSMGTLQEQSTGRWKTILVDQIESCETTLAHVFPEVAGNIAAPIALMLALFFVDWRMALLTIVVFPVGMVFMMGMMKGYAEKYSEAVKTGKEMNDAIVEYIGGVKEIKTFNQGSKSYARLSDSVTRNASFYYNWMKTCMTYTSLSRNIAPAVLLTVLPLGLFFYIGGSLSFLDFVTVMILSLSIVSPIIKVVNYTDNLAVSDTVIASIETILKAPEQHHPQKNVVLQNTTIQMQNVHFHYNDVGKKVLNGVSLMIEPGTKTALVGPSGSGKSTLAKLMAAFWDVEEGSILLGGYPLTDIPLTQISDTISYVAQDNFLFDDTVRENIRMGKETASDQEVEEIAKAAGCHDFIMKLEKGYETNVGGSGAHLSGGERQRITIARAMLKNAPIVILDEATAYIDPENEAILQEAISKLVKDKTLIVIAHRLSTITDSDQIVVVANGEIDSVGTHNELLASSSLYQNMWESHIDAKEA